MAINYNLDQYRNWLNENTTLTDPFSPQALRDMVYHILMGRNYRLLTEPNTKGRLFATFFWLSKVQESAIENYGDEWVERLTQDLVETNRKPEELKNLMQWLMGLTTKTSVNLGLDKGDYVEIIRETVGHFDELFDRIDGDFKNKAWLLLMAGSATLNIRGSQKSKVGKQVERVFLKAILNILGFEQDNTFWMNVERDLEVEREADAEVQSRRGRIRIEVGLIAPGNQEVVEDKIARVGRNGIIIFDKLGSRTRVHQTAERAQVKLIQIRNGNPLLEVYRHLEPLVDVDLNEIPENPNEIRNLVNDLPDDIFQI
ncbi:MAG: hypothetical protein Tsb0034_00380 [Ekhidna sp.]